MTRIVDSDFIDWLWNIRLEKEIKIIRKRRLIESVSATDMETHNKIIEDIEEIKEKLKYDFIDDEKIIKEYSVVLSVRKMEGKDDDDNR